MEMVGSATSPLGRDGTVFTEEEGEVRGGGSDGRDRPASGTALAEEEGVGGRDAPREAQRAARKGRVLNPTL